MRAGNPAVLISWPVRTPLIGTSSRFRHGENHVGSSQEHGSLRKDEEVCLAIAAKSG